MTNATTSRRETHGKQLARLQREVAALRRQLKDAQKLASMGTMAAMVAHEFNNILTPIVNYARLAKKNPKLIDKALAHAANGASQATTICGALLGLTEKTDPQQVKLGEIVARTFDAIARDLARDAIDLRIDIPADLTLTTRPAELQQVLANLIVNARAALLGANGLRKLTISARPENGGTVIQVADNGVGIEPENIDRIFEAFFTTNGPDNGHGLGLAFCREVVDLLDGEISVESTPGRGATFTIHLP